jgi:hypothetical protein
MISKSTDTHSGIWRKFCSFPTLYDHIPDTDGVKTSLWHFQVRKRKDISIWRGIQLSNRARRFRLRLTIAYITVARAPRCLTSVPPRLPSFSFFRRGCAVQPSTMCVSLSSETESHHCVPSRATRFRLEIRQSRDTCASQPAPCAVVPIA